MEKKEIIETIDERVEYSVSEKMNKLSKWMIGTALVMFGILFLSFIGNAYWMGKIDSKIESISTTVSENKSDRDKLNEYEQNQLIILMHIKRLDPDFDIGLILRGGHDNNGS